METYWNGDRAKYTGKSQEMHGELFYEIRILEGHLKGERRWTVRVPKKRGEKLGTAERKGFTNGEPWTATEEDCKKPWGGGRNGSRFRCTLCGYRFKLGDTVRWQYTNDVQGAGGNPLVCTDCDGSKEEIVREMKARYAELDGRMWSFCSQDD